MCGLLLAGCVTVPTSGHVQSVNVTQGGTGGGQSYLQPIPVPPGHGWSPQQIVSGFLAANASFANGHAVAREYLTPPASRTWHPGWAVTVFGQNPSIVTPVRSPYSGKTAATTVVEVSGPVLGSVSDSGQYAISPQGQASAPEKFQLVRQGGEWRISNLPSVVLLTQADFVHVYQPRNIYFFDPAMQVLLPDPVYVPQEATPADLVTQLLQVLLAAPSGWLLDAAQTAFPAGTRLLNVSLDGGTAIVNLSGRVAGVSDETLRRMSAQLLWTLAGSSADQPSIQSVELEVNGTPRTLLGTGSPVQQIGSYSSYVPSAAAHASFYYADSRGAVRSLSGTAQANAPQGALVPGQAGTGQIPLAQVAVSPNGRYVAGIGPGAALYTGRLMRSATLTQRATGPFTSLSWDTHDNLWATDSNGQLWLVPGPGGAATQVTTALGSGKRITALKVAPDGVRCALLVTGSGGSQLMLAAIVHSGSEAFIGPAVPISSQNSHFIALTWYDPDHMIVLSRPSGNPVLDEVAINGEMLVPVSAQEGTVSIAADGSSNPLVAGLSNGQMATLASLGGLWSGFVGAGRAPAYPG
jgi:Lipoprotein LpqB beta-propeller domain/Sporulation and spore germination